MKTLKFEGYSDDTFGEYGITNKDVDNCASGKPIQCLINSQEGRMLVVGQYAESHLSGCWVIGVSMVDEDEPIPEWPIRVKSAENGYSPRLEIDVPDDADLTFYSGREISSEVRSTLVYLATCANLMPEAIELIKYLRETMLKDASYVQIEGEEKCYSCDEELERIDNFLTKLKEGDKYNGPDY